MLNSEPDKKFDAWLSDGLKKQVTVKNDFAERLLARLDTQQGEQLLQSVHRQQNIYKGLIIGLILSCLGIVSYPPVTDAVFAFLQSSLTYLIELVMEPTLTGVLIPVGILLTVIAVIWNLLDMVSLE